MCELGEKKEDQNSTAKQEPNCSPLPTNVRLAACRAGEESDLQTQVSRAPRKFTGTLNIGLKPDGMEVGKKWRGEGEDEEEASARGEEEVHGP